MCFLASSLQKPRKWSLVSSQWTPNHRNENSEPPCSLRDTPQAGILYGFCSPLPPSPQKAAGTGAALLLVNSQQLSQDRWGHCLVTFLCPLPLPSGHFTGPVYPINRVDRGNERIWPQYEKILFLIRGPGGKTGYTAPLISHEVWEMSFAPNCYTITHEQEQAKWTILTLDQQEICFRWPLNNVGS